MSLKQTHHSAQSGFIVMQTRRLLAFGLLMLICCIGHAASDQAVVRALGPTPLEVGQAFIAHYGDLCIALLPTHVVKEAGVASLRYVGTRRPVLGELEQATELGGDLTLGIIKGGLVRDCGHSLDSFSRAVDARLNAGNQGALRFVNGDGSLGFEPVAWLDDDRERFIRVEPITPGHTFYKGMSGSLLMSRDNTPIGMLLSVSSRSGIGKVLLDYVQSSASPHRPSFSRRSHA